LIYVANATRNPRGEICFFQKLIKIDSVIRHDRDADAGIA